MVQTAGNDRAVPQDTDLVPQTVAENIFAAVFGTKIRPVKFVTVFQIDPLSDPGASGFFLPFPGKSGMQTFQYGIVLTVLTALVPQPEDNEFLSFRSLTKGEAMLQISFERNRQIICFKGM